MLDTYDIWELIRHVFYLILVSCLIIKDLSTCMSMCVCSSVKMYRNKNDQFLVIYVGSNIYIFTWFCVCDRYINVIITSCESRKSNLILFIREISFSPLSSFLPFLLGVHVRMSVTDIYEIREMYQYLY